MLKSPGFAGLAAAFLLGPTIYIGMAVGPVTVAFRSVDYAMLCAMAGFIPVLFAHNNAGEWTKASLLGAVAYAATFLLIFASFSMVYGMPGSDFVTSSEVTMFLLFPFAAAAFVVASRPAGAILFAVAAFVSLSATIEAVRLATAHAMSHEVEATLAAGGVVRVNETGDNNADTQRWTAITSVPPFGTIVGARSPRVRFIRKDGEEFEWRYSRFEAQRLSLYR